MRPGRWTPVVCGLTAALILSSAVLKGAEMAVVPVGAGPAADKNLPVKDPVTSLPRLPAVLNEALQSRDFATAIKLIDQLLAEKKFSALDYLLYLKARSQADLDQAVPAMETYEALEKQYPSSPWISRSRFGRGAIFAKQRNYQASAAIYKSETERLLSAGRTDELTSIYLEFADRYFQGEPEKGPTMARHPDYTQALEYYQQALVLRPSLALRQKIELQIARSHQELNQLNVAIPSYQAFLRQYGEANRPGKRVAPPDLLALAQFHLGRAQLAAPLPAEARKTWQDFIQAAVPMEGQSEAVQKQVQNLRLEATYLLARTHGMPQPPTIGDLELGVTALETFIKAYPNDKRVMDAQLDIAQGYIHHGRIEQAVTQLKKLTEVAKEKSSPTAWNLLGQVYARQKNFKEAIATWQKFLELFPTDPQWSAVQQVIVDTEYAMGEELRGEKQFAAARTAWETFLNKYPLDARAPVILYAFGEMRHQEALATVETRKAAAVRNALFEEALADWARLVSKYPGSPQASQAAFMRGVTLEQNLGKLAEALEAYKKVQGDFQARAQQAIGQLTAHQLHIVTERKFRSNEKAVIKVTTRNIEDLTVKLYRIDMTDYFKKQHLASGVESLDIALIDPDKTWDQKVEGYTQYRRTEQEIQIPVEGPGVTAVTVSSDSLEATTMVVVSDIDILVKSSRNELFVFVENMLEAKPAEGVTLLVSDGSKVFAELKTDANGVVQKSFEELKTVNDLRVFAVKDAHSASSLANLQGLQFAVGLSAKGYLFTDRPAYKAGQLVNLKAVIRQVDQDRYVFKAGEKYKLDVYDARSRVIHSQEVALGDFGSFAANWKLPTSSPQGEYRVHVYQPGRDQSYETRFTVHEYQLEPVQFSVELPQRVFYRGEHVKGKLILKYYYGTPISGRTVQYRLADDRLYTAETDANGEVAFDLPTQRYSEAQALQLSADYPERNLHTAATVQLATRGFDISLSTLRSVYISGETFDLSTLVNDAAGKPLGTALKLEVLEVTNFHGRSGEKLVQSAEMKTDDKTGKATQTLRIEKSGTYTIRATGTDRFNNAVSGSMTLMVSGEEDTVRLRILADKHNFKVGDTGKVQLHWRDKPALALVTYEGASILGYQLLSLKTGSNEFDLPMVAKLAPNFNLSVSVMDGSKYHHADSEFRVARELKITLKPSATTLRPGDPLTVELLVTDPQGNPVSADLTLALIQKSLLDMYPDQSPEVQEFFGGNTRQVSVRATTSCTFHYQPPTRAINEFLLAEVELEQIRAEEELARKQVAGVMQNSNMIMGGAFIADGTALDSVDRPASGSGSEEAGRPRTKFSKRYGLRDNRQSGLKGQADSSEPFQTFSIFKDETTTWADANSDRYYNYGFANNFGNQIGIQVINPEGKSVRMNFNTAELGNTARGWEFLCNCPTTVVAKNGRGEFQVVNGLAVADLQKLAREGGLEIMPEMTNAETAYWNPQVISDKDGKATLVIRLPDRSTAWKLVSRGMNIEALGGQAEAEIITKKDLFAEIQTPLAFTTGDKAQVQVEVHNAALKEGEIVVTLTATIGTKSVEQKQTLKVTKTGIEELRFPVEIGIGDSVDFELSVAAGDQKDFSGRSVPIQPYGMPVYATASGTSGQNTSFAVQHSAALGGAAVQNPALEILIGPSVNRTLLDAVLGSSMGLYERNIPQPRTDLERSLSDVLGGVALMKMVGHTRTTDTPEAQALAGRIQGGLALLVSSQRDDGGWNWSGSAKSEAADRYLSSRCLWALAAARNGGFAVPQDTFNKAVQHLQTLFAAAPETDIEGKAIILHGLAEAGVADFAHANRLHRSRNALSSSGLVHVALTLIRLDRKPMAAEILALAKAKIPVAKAAQDVAIVGCVPWMQSGVELRALYLAALNELEPAGPHNAALADWLMSARSGSRWNPEKANGPAIVALADWFGRAKLTPEKYTLSVFVNDKLLEKFTVDPSTDGSKTLPVPAKLMAADKPQRINIDIEGRGTFSYSAVLTGFVDTEKLVRTTNDWHVSRSYAPAQRMLDGEALARGFDVVSGSYDGFENAITQLPVGERLEVSLYVNRDSVQGTPYEQLDYLVVTEPIPAGAMVLTESIVGTYDRYEITPGAITFYLGDRPHLGSINYTLVGYLPGDYKTGKTVVRSFYQPEKIVVTNEKPLTVLARGEKSKDEYRLTPRELYEFGKRYVAKGDFAEASKHLTTLFKDWRLQDGIYREVVEMLFQCSLSNGSHGDIVQYFEIIKEKYPDVEVSFENILKVGEAYTEIGEYERSYLVYRGTAEAGFQRESQIAGFLNQRGEFLRSVQVMERLLREYPAEAYVAMATYALAQEVYGKAQEAAGDEKLRAAGVTRIDLIAISAHMLDTFLSTWPDDPAADQASFSLANALLDLQQYDRAIERCTKFAERFPNSKLLDSFWYVIGYSQFAKGKPDAALEMCRKVADFKRTDPATGVEVASANQWQAIYIMGQVFHSQGKPADAIAEYGKVKDRFADASEAIDFFMRKDLSLPEVTTVKPGEPGKVALKFRNVTSANIKVYRIDLLKFGLLQRNLSRITAINLAGIRPYHALSVELGDGKDYRDREHPLNLPLKEEGAYLVVCQGESLYASGLVLVSPLALEVQEDAVSGRVRVTVKDTVADRYANNVHIKVIGSLNSQFVSGQSDLRGIFVADGISGTSTIIARSEANRYAFYRGKLPLAMPAPNAAPAAQEPATEEKKPAANGDGQLLEQLRNQNNDFNSIQRDNYRNLLDNKSQGVKAKAAF